MCMGCMANADFVITSGIVGAASLRVAARSALPGVIRRPRKVTEAEVSGFLASLRPAEEPAELAEPAGALAEGSAKGATGASVREPAPGQHALVP